MKIYHLSILFLFGIMTLVQVSQTNALCTMPALSTGTTECSTTMSPESTDTEIVTWAHDNALTRYSSLYTFRPYDSISRQEFAKIFVAWLDTRDISRSITVEQPPPFLDDTTIDPTLRDYVYRLLSYGLMKGNNQVFSPKDNISYNEVAIVLGRLGFMIEKNTRNILESSISIQESTKPMSRIEVLQNLFYTIEKTKSTATYLQSVQKNLDAARSQWSKNTLKQYNLTRTVGCFCAGDYIRPITYIITDSAVVVDSARFSDTGTGTVPPGVIAELSTVEQAFDLIQKQIDNKVATIDADYDATYGYPTKIFIDQVAMMVDEEISYRFSLTRE